MVDSLRPFFPDEVEKEEVFWDEEPRMVNEVTTRPLPGLTHGQAPDRAMQLLADAIVEEAITGKKRGQGPADLVIAVCDVELGNLGKEPIILSHLRSALEKRLDRHEQGARARHRATLREKCSFHLLRPMVEAVFFGDPAALSRSGVSATHPPLLRSLDVEEFESVDPNWHSECVEANDRKRLDGVHWWEEARHPKRYLAHLIQRSGSKVYDELDQGVAALCGLHWPTVTNIQPSPFLRALFDDLASWFGVPNPLGFGKPSPLTSLTPTSPPDRWLRNL